MSLMKKLSRSIYSQINWALNNLFRIFFFYVKFRDQQRNLHLISFRTILKSVLLDRRWSINWMLDGTLETWMFQQSACVCALTDTIKSNKNKNKKKKICQWNFHLCICANKIQFDRFYACVDVLCRWA